MMVAVDDDDDFIVQPPGEGDGAEAADGSNRGQQQQGASRYFLQGFRRLVFAKGEGESGKPPAEPEPTLPSGFSAILNAEEEEIYPADAKIRVVLAEGSLGGRGRRQAAELHQSLQQVVATAAIYSHLIRKHGSSGISRRRSASDAGSGEARGVAVPVRCGCGGADGPCKAISNLLRDELAKVTDVAEAERRGALLKKLRQAERRSGGLCNPAQLHREASTSSLNAADPLPDLSGAVPVAPVAPVLDSPRRGLSSWGGGMAALATAASAAGSPPLLSLGGNHSSSGSSGSSGGGSGAGSSPVGVVSKRPADVPWADNMLTAVNRKRHGSMLKARGRDLAKRLSVIVPPAAGELQAVAARLPPWGEIDTEGEGASVQQLSLHGNTKGNSHIHSNNSANRTTNPSGPVTSTQSPADQPPASSAQHSSSSSNGSAVSSSLPPAPSRAATVPLENDPKFTQPKAIFGTNEGARRGSRLGPSLGSDGGELVVVDARKQQQDWKLSAQELSMINKEEELVMPPEVLGKLLSAGAVIESHQQRDFWDIFSRLEIVTRTEALLNIALRGGKGCPARAGRMGRELCMSLTSVVLDAIAAVKKKQDLMPTHAPTAAVQQHQSPENKEEDRTRHLSLKKGEGRTLQQELQKARNCRSGEIQVNRSHRPPRKEESQARGRFRSKISPKKSGVPPRGGLKEDPGLSDLDEREGEFRQAIYVLRSALSERLLVLTDDAPLSAEVLGNFVNGVVAPASSSEDLGGRNSHHPSSEDDTGISCGDNETPAKQTAVTTNESPDDTALEGDGRVTSESSARSCAPASPTQMAPPPPPCGLENSAEVAPRPVARVNAHNHRDSVASWHARGPSKDGDDTLLFECSSASPEGGSQPSTPPSMASTTPLSDAGDEPARATSDASAASAASGRRTEWDNSPPSDHNILPASSDDTSPAATKPSRVDVGAAHDEGGAAEQVEVAMVQERNVSSTAPNSPPAF